MSHHILHEKKQSLQVLYILNKELHNIQRIPCYSKNISLLRAICLRNFLKQHTRRLEWLRKLLQSHTQCKKRIQFVQTFLNCTIENKVYNPNTIFITN